MSRFASLFETFVHEWHLSPILVATVIIQYPKRLKKERLDCSLLDEASFKSILEAFKQGNIPRDAIYYVMKETVRRNSFTPELLPVLCSPEELKKTVRQSIIAFDTMLVHRKEKKRKILLGIVMNTLRGRVESGAVDEQISSELRQ